MESWKIISQSAFVPVDWHPDFPLLSFAQYQAEVLIFQDTSEPLNHNSKGGWELEGINPQMYSQISQTQQHRRALN